jgi:ABC-type transport system involved in multi-copper enzyme maturation permease subunit
MKASLITQLSAVFRMELRKTFFARRGLWVYLLAFAPALLFAANSIYAPRERARLKELARAHPATTSQAIAAVHVGLSRDEVVQALGEPYGKRSERRRIGPDRLAERDVYRYTDGEGDFRLFFNDGRLRGINRTDPGTLAENRLVFASIFQFYYLRLAIFFGCVGIFMNLIRGEMLDKSLHFYLLTPLPREVILAGKYLAALVATLGIFVTSTALQLVMMLGQFDRPEIAAYLHGSGWAEIGAYLGVTALACLGYGTIFLVAGLLFRNPIVPAAVVLVWESINLFVPIALKQISVIYYLQSLCPVAPPADATLPAALNALISTGEPATAAVAMGVLVALSALGFVLAGRLARNLEINYSTD